MWASTASSIIVLNAEVSSRTNGYAMQRSNSLSFRAHRMGSVKQKSVEEAIAWHVWGILYGVVGKVA